MPSAAGRGGRTRIAGRISTSYAAARKADSDPPAMTRTTRLTARLSTLHGTRQGRRAPEH
ncbi:hypothetical protein [Actinomadura sp. SCN-SB]|uniref:hypothetical protein n=1 Tax=Actinomadura sp. SCN-SB TaxID=3373092 RepID=UPI00375301FD